jgi:hypothetical protein
VIEVRLVSGDVEATGKIVWTASSSISWLQLRSTTGTVYTGAPYVPVEVVTDATGLNDTFATGPLNGSVVVASIMPVAGLSSVFENETGHLTIPVELEIVSDIDIDSSELKLQTDDGSVLLDVQIGKRPDSEIEVAEDGKLTATFKAFDYERFPIVRPDLRIEIRLRYLGENGIKDLGRTGLLFLTDNVYRAEVPGKWLTEPGNYHLIIASNLTELGNDHLSIGSNNGAMTTRIIVVSSKLKLYIAGGISGVSRLGA